MSQYIALAALRNPRALQRLGMAEGAVAWCNAASRCPETPLTLGRYLSCCDSSRMCCLAKVACLLVGRMR